MKFSNLKQINFNQIFKSYWLIILLTIIGAFLRLYNFHSTLMFLGDQGRDALIVKNLLKHFDPILVGPTTSVGKIQLGPFYYYFMAPFLLLSNFDPIGPALVIVFLGIFSIPLFYFVCQKMFGKTLSIIASILYTFSNVIITFTRFSWNPNPLPLVTLLIIYLIYLIYQEKKFKYIPWIFALYAIALQLHYMVILLGPALFILYLLIFFENKKNRKEIISKTWLGLLIFFIFAIPLIVFDLLKDFLNTKGFLEFFQKGDHTNNSIKYLIPRISQRNKQILAEIINLKGAKIKAYFSYIPTLFLLAKSIISRKNKALQIITLTFFSSFLGFILYSSDVYEHYLTFIFPISIITISLGLEFIWKQKLFGKLITSLIIFFIILTNIKQYRYYHPLGWTVNNTKKLSQTIAEDVGESSYNIVLLDETKDYRAMQYRYFLDNTNIKDYGEFNDPETLYLISQWDYQNLENIELRELEIFFNTALMRMNAQQNAEFLETKIIKSWYFPNGPYVYKLHK